jgi:putative component of membrane protein insertase Oxa1/YidC/SpoIIIJ protein YidD
MRYLNFSIILFIIGAPVFSQPKMQGPSNNTSVSSLESYGSGSNIILNIYQNWLSPVKGGNTCPMHPSCSQYSKILFASRSPYEAYIETLERILRCGHEPDFYKTIEINGVEKCYDPPPINGKSNVDENIHENLIQPSLTVPVQISQSNSNDTSFAENLFISREYYRAATEYMRLKYYATDSLQTIEYLRKIGLCYYFGESYEQFIRYMKENNERLKIHKSILSEMKILLSKSYYHLGNFQHATSILEIANVSENDKLYDDYKFILGVCYAKLFQWDESLENFSAIRSSYNQSEIVKTIKVSLTDIGDFPKRTPWVAGTFSAVLPGSGYLYAGRPQTAITSFIVNALLAWSVRDAIRHKSYGLTATFGFFGLGWYFGNIIGSINAVNEYNYQVKNNYVDKLLKDVNIDTELK